MRRTVVVEDKTVDDAVEKACEKYGVDKESLKHDVISYGASGIFGIVGFKKAKIKVYLPEEKDTKDIPLQRTPTKTTPPQIEPKVPEENLVAKQSIPQTDNMGTAPSSPKERNADIEQASQIGESLLMNIINRITDDATIETKAENDTITFQIIGGNAGILIGKKGQTLEAIQYIIEKAINNKCEIRQEVLIDIEDYMENKISRLEGMAIKTAEKVKKIGKPVSVGQMNSQDRKIVHIALKNDPDIRTQSVGEGYYRKLVVFPKGFSRKKQKGPKNNAPNPK